MFAGPAESGALFTSFRTLLTHPGADTEIRSSVVIWWHRGTEGPVFDLKDDSAPMPVFASLHNSVPVKELSRPSYSPQ